MLSEAIEKLSGKKNETTWDDTIRQIKREEIKDVVVTRQKYITAVLNLIEKQSKEIEELKEKNKKLQDKAKELIFEKQELTSALLDSTPNDKIKAKIEEVEQWELYNMKIPRLSTLDERLGAKIGIKYVLQSLLEKE